MSAVVIHGEALESLRAMPSDSFDALMCDPPYGLGNRQPTADELIAYLSGAELETGGDFMGKEWHVPSVAIWREAFRVLKPGAPLLAFAGSRTMDLVGIGIRAAGFELRDSIAWMHASGFPKSHNVSKAIDAANGDERPVVSEVATRWKYANEEKSARCYGAESRPTDERGYLVTRVTSAASAASAAWDGYGTALKPAWECVVVASKPLHLEPIVLARKPLDGTMVQNIAKHGCGPLAIDASRIEYASVADREKMSAGVEAIRARGGVMEGSWKNSSDLSGANPASDAGRWPSNVILDDAAANFLDAQTGDCPSALTGRADPTLRHAPEASVGRAMASMFGNARAGSGVYADSGGASRFFFVAKPSKSERVLGTGHLEKLIWRIKTWEGADLEVVLLVDTAVSPPKVIAVYGMLPSTDIEWSTWLFGNLTADPCPPGLRFTIATKTNSTTVSRIWHHSPRLRTSESTADASCATACGGSRASAAGPSNDLTETTGTLPAAVSPTRGAGPATLREFFASIASAELEIRSAADHPTLKPIALTRYLARLVLPPPRSTPRRIVVPFAGSGSEMIGALLAGWDDVTGIEKEFDYVQIARARLKVAVENPRAFDAEVRATAEKPNAAQISIFGTEGT